MPSMPSSCMALPKGGRKAASSKRSNAGCKRKSKRGGRRSAAARGSGASRDSKATYAGSDGEATDDAMKELFSKDDDDGVQGPEFQLGFWVFGLRSQVR